MIKENEELNKAIEAARKAGEILKDNFGQKYRVIRKSPKEMVSVVDMQAQKVILDILEPLFPGYGIITEERTTIVDKNGKNWIIDPLDGTHNYIAGLPFSGVSIGLAKGNDFQLGVILFPMEDRLYYAVKGEGAYFNHMPIEVSPSLELSKSIISFDNQFHLNKNSFEYYRKLTGRAFTTRILGTATNDLCMTAEGKLGGRIWVNTKICDIAAGIVIVTEAGGKVTSFDGAACTLDSKHVVASNGKIHEELLEIVN
ncbi:MAG: inositol monophosphatase [Candidatus Aminicenantes bacterium]|nr:inositol monophosphatase [Candidatus Aminicenantes bacterium]